jgi:hypothetical protein
MTKEKLLEAVDILDNATIDINNEYEDLLTGENAFDEEYWDRIAEARQLLREFINNEDYQMLADENKHMAEFLKTLNYTPEQISNICNGVPIN